MDGAIVMDEPFIRTVLRRALCNPHTAANTAQLAERVLDENIPGDLVECGVFAGTQPAIMARALMDRGIKHRRVHLWDSFEGIPYASEEDGDMVTGMLGPRRDGQLASTGVSRCSIHDVKANMRDWGIDPELLVYHRGWFQHTMPFQARDIGRIALLRLDADLYHSTMVALQYLYRKLSPGGYCIIDDYGLDGCRRAVTEYMEAIGEEPEIQRIPGEWSVVYWRRD